MALLAIFRKAEATSRGWPPELDNNEKRKRPLSFDRQDMDQKQFGPYLCDEAQSAATPFHVLKLAQRCRDRSNKGLGEAALLPHSQDGL